jgi:hypothetical protein
MGGHLCCFRCFLSSITELWNFGPCTNILPSADRVIVTPIRSGTKWCDGVRIRVIKSHTSPKRTDFSNIMPGFWTINKDYLANRLNAPRLDHSLGLTHKRRVLKDGKHKSHLWRLRKGNSYYIVL